MPRRREENEDVVRSKSRDRQQQKQAATGDIEVPPEKRRKHRKAVADDGGAEAPVDASQVKRSSRQSQDLDAELQGAGVERKASRKHRKSGPERDVSIDSEDLRGADKASPSKTVEQSSSTGVNYKELYRKASKTLSKGSKADDDLEAAEVQTMQKEKAKKRDRPVRPADDLDLAALEAQMIAKEEAKTKKSHRRPARPADDLDLAALEAQMIATEEAKARKSDRRPARPADDLDLAALEAQMIANEEAKEQGRASAPEADDLDLEALEEQMGAHQKAKMPKRGSAQKSDELDLDALEAQMVANENAKEKARAAPSVDELDFEAIEAQVIAQKSIKKKKRRRAAPQSDDQDDDLEAMIAERAAKFATADKTAEENDLEEIQRRSRLNDEKASGKPAKGKGRAPAQGSYSSDSDQPAARPIRRSQFAATPADSSAGIDVKNAPATTKGQRKPAPKRQQRRRQASSYSYSDSEEPAPRHARFFGSSTNESLPEALKGVTDPSAATGVKEALAGVTGLAVGDEPAQKAVGVSGIDFTEVREIREKEMLKRIQQEQKEELAKALEKEIVSAPKDPLDMKAVQEQMAVELGKARKAKEDNEREAAQKEQQEKEYYHANLGEPCGPEDRFTVIELLGKGEFASVYRCRDREVRDHTGAYVEYAIKFTRNNDQLVEAMDREIIMLGNICTAVAEHDREGGRHILGLMFLNGFEHDEHLCCVYELMKCDLRVAMQRYTAGAGFPLYPTVRNLAKQLLLALRALRVCNILHCDVKPDNILLGLDRETIKLSDFGSALEDHERKRTEYLQPRHYRCPEIILGQTFSTQIDMWSAGCTIFELATGKPFFVGQTNNAMMHEYLKVHGPISKHFATVGHFAKKHFKEENCDFLNAAGDYLVGTNNPAVLPMSHFEPPRRPLKGLIDTIQKPGGVDPQRFDGLRAHLTTLLRKCCAIDPAERATPDEALKLKFFEPGAR